MEFPYKEKLSPVFDSLTGESFHELKDEAKMSAFSHFINAFNEAPVSLISVYMYVNGKANSKLCIF